MSKKDLSSSKEKRQYFNFNFRNIAKLIKAGEQIETNIEQYLKEYNYTAKTFEERFQDEIKKVFSCKCKVVFKEIFLSKEFIDTANKMLKKAGEEAKITDIKLPHNELKLQCSIYLSLKGTNYHFNFSSCVAAFVILEKLERIYEKKSCSPGYTNEEFKEKFEKDLNMLESCKIQIRFYILDLNTEFVSICKEILKKARA